MTTILAQEQQRLRKVYQQLTAEQAFYLQQQQRNQQQAVAMKGQFAQDSSLNMATVTDKLDTFAALEAMNREIDQYNFSASVLANKLRQIKLLLPAAYFGKVVVHFADEPAVSTPFYIGVTGYQTRAATDLVYDWRSSIAGLYYDQVLGASSYQANGQTIAATIEARRQFKIDHAQLLGYFDSQIAVEDPLLIAVLSQEHQQHLTAITATIQKEQNAIIRDEQTQALIIRGVAGSGKTSVVIQRIAYLLYRQRQTVRASDILLLTPNELFTDYISQVLPTLGEANPWQATLQQLLTQMQQQLLGTAAVMPAWSTQASHLEQLRLALTKLNVTAALFKSLPDWVTATQLAASYARTPVTATLAERLKSVQLNLRRQLEQEIRAAATDDRVLTALDNLSLAQQNTIFGQPLQADNERQLHRYARQLRRYQLQERATQIATYAWLDWPAWLHELLPQTAASLTDFVFLLVRLTKFSYPQIKFLLVDELQDYQLEELQLLTALFPQAQLTLLGDENQALNATTPGFEKVADQLAAQNKRVKIVALNKSYRSTQEVTTLFREFAVAADLQVVPVQRHGRPPVLHQSADFAAMITALSQALSTEQAGTTAIVTLAATQVDPIYAALRAQQPTLPLVKNSATTTGQTVILPLRLAKGLEFDRVLLLDVGQNALSAVSPTLLKRLLYTGISRATQTVELFATGQVQPLITQAFNALKK
ncbi:HelD family protein [Loigolactobacillus binensis]|uniref:HelD family protein n=1 Tax=Loigolactobacillus binensis TaxID=2559922 RepID=A0ABW3EBC2_9LACO|nr:UvrD-helicase domain-containing protein [Loigolactobacillus binensis]